MLATGIFGGLVKPNFLLIWNNELSVRYKMIFFLCLFSFSSTFTLFEYCIHWGNRYELGWLPSFKIWCFSFHWRLRVKKRNAKYMKPIEFSNHHNHLLYSIIYILSDFIHRLHCIDQSKLCPSVTWLIFSAFIT